MTSRALRDPQAGFLKETDSQTTFYPLHSTDGVRWAWDQATVRTITVDLSCQGNSAHSGLQKVTESS